MTSWDYLKAVIREAMEQKEDGPPSTEDIEARDGICEFIDVVCECHYRGVSPKDAIQIIKVRLGDIMEKF